MNAIQIYEIASKVNPNGDENLYGVLRILNQYDGRISEMNTKTDGNEHVKLKEVHWYDIEGGGKYCWELNTLWFKDSPIAIIQRAGRYGESHEEIYVTDEKLMDEAMNYLYILNKQDENEDYSSPMVIDASEDLPHLTEFYDYKLNYFYAEDIEILYKVGDIIEVEIADEMNHYGLIDEDKQKTKRKVKVIKVDETNPSFTYQFYELERKRVEAYKFNEIMENTNFDVEDGFRIHGWLNCELMHIK